jgi:small conductance mechanosensitive channel
LVDLFLVLVVGWLAQFLLLRLLRYPRALLEDRHQSSTLVRLPLAFGRLIVALVPTVGFVAAGMALTAVLNVSSQVRYAALLLLGGYALANAVMVLARVLLRPEAGSRRMIPVGDETASYLIIWIRRLSVVAIYGFFLLMVIKLLGFPADAHVLLMKLLGLVVTTMAVIFLMQNRQPVAAWIRGGAGSGRPLAALRLRLADIWHVLAALYIVAVYAIWALHVQGGFEFVLRASILTLCILAAASLAGAGMYKLVDRAFAISPETRQRFPGLELRANRYLPVLRNVLRIAIGVIAVLALLQAWGMESFAWLATDVGRRVLSALITIGAALIAALVVWELVSAAIERALARNPNVGAGITLSARARTLLPLARNVLMVVLVVLVSLTVLSELGVNIAPLLAGAGVVGLAIGFGSQKLVQDVITGIFILIEDSVAVGDAVKLGDHSGVVEAMSIRSIRLRDGLGQVHTVPFSAVSTVINMTKDYSCLVIDMGVAYREDVDEVMETMRQVVEEMRAEEPWSQKITMPLEVMGIERFADSAVIIRAKLTARPGEQGEAGREFNRRIKARFDALGIEIPFPHTTIYFGEGKDGRAPPANLRLARERPEEPAAPKRVKFVPAEGDFPLGEDPALGTAGK